MARAGARTSVCAAMGPTTRSLLVLKLRSSNDVRLLNSCNDFTSLGLHQAGVVNLDPH
jgi:hypothetical protein